MRVTADLEKCEGYANCVAAAPEIYDIDDDGKVVLLQVDVDEAKRDDVEEAVRTCPVSALDVEG
jgi:ferredoxin